MIWSFFARRRDAKTRKLVGIKEFYTRAYNPILDDLVTLKATAKLYVTDAGVRSAELSHKSLMDEYEVMAWLELGDKPMGMTVCA